LSSEKERSRFVIARQFPAAERLVEEEEEVLRRDWHWPGNWEQHCLLFCPVREDAMNTKKTI
jgi:hypothetical protein